MSWVIQIYDMSDVEAQELVLGLLQGLDGTTVESAHRGADHYLVVECVDANQARSVFNLVTSVDHNAALLHSTSGRVRDFELRPTFRMPLTPAADPDQPDERTQEPV